jgi:hypothetical protein
VALAVGTAAIVGLILAVNYFGLQAGEVGAISRWVSR